MVPFNTDHFYPRTSFKWGLDNICRPCRRKSNARYYAANKDKVYAQQKEWRKRRKAQA